MDIKDIKVGEKYKVIGTGRHHTYATGTEVTCLEIIDMEEDIVHVSDTTGTRQYVYVSEIEPLEEQEPERPAPVKDTSLSNFIPLDIPVGVPLLLRTTDETMPYAVGYWHEDFACFSYVKPDGDNLQSIDMPVISYMEIE